MEKPIVMKAKISTILANQTALLVSRNEEEDLPNNSENKSVHH